LAFGIFAGVAFIGFILSFGIRGENLEAEGWSEDDDEEEEDEEAATANGSAGEGSNEGSSLLRK
jgi:hypothetical protein